MNVGWRQNVLNAAENAPKMSEANRRGHSSEARTRRARKRVRAAAAKHGTEGEGYQKLALLAQDNLGCERPRQNFLHDLHVLHG